MSLITDPFNTKTIGGHPYSATAESAIHGNTCSIGKGADVPQNTFKNPVSLSDLKEDYRRIFKRHNQLRELMDMLNRDDRFPQQPVARIQGLNENFTRQYFYSLEEQLRVLGSLIAYMEAEQA